MPVLSLHYLAVWVAAAIDFLFLNSLNRSQAVQRLWISLSPPFSLSLTSPDFLTYAPSSFQSFTSQLSSLSARFPLVAVMFCSASVTGAVSSVGSRDPEVKKKKFESSLERRSSSDSCSGTHRPRCASVDLKNRIGFFGGGGIFFLSSFLTSD